LRSPSTTTPLAQLAVSLYYKKGRKLDSAAMASLEDELDKSAEDTNALFWGLSALAVVSNRLEAKGDLAAAGRLTKFIKRQRSRYPDLEQGVISLSMDRASDAQRYRTEKRPLTAPVFGARLPEGSRRLFEIVDPNTMQARRLR
jgi:hypothetical protein